MICSQGNGDVRCAARAGTGEFEKKLAAPFVEKFADCLSNVGQLERSVESLKEQNKKLQEQVSRLQAQADDRAGRLKVLMTFIQTSLRDQVETRAEKAAIRIFERLVAGQGDETPEGER